MDDYLTILYRELEISRYSDEDNRLQDIITEQLQDIRKTFPDLEINLWDHIQVVHPHPVDDDVVYAIEEEIETLLINRVIEKMKS